MLLTPKMQAPLRCESFPTFMVSGKNMRAGLEESDDHRSSHSGFRQSRDRPPQANTWVGAFDERSTWIPDHWAADSWNSAENALSQRFGSNQTPFPVGFELLDAILQVAG